MHQVSQTLKPGELDEMIPQEPAFLGETGLDAAFAAELALKALYYSAHPTAGELAETLAVSVPVMQEVLTQLTRDGLCEIVAGEGQTHAAYRYRLSGRGLERSASAFERNAYVGPAPVPLRDYIGQVRRQSAGGSGFTADVVKQALSQLVLSDSTRGRVGRAIFSGRPTLIYGPSGNGKTTIAHLLGQALAGYIAVPYALEVYGHIVRLFDPSKHERFDYEERPGDLRRRRHDRRWAIIRRPAVLAGGELTRQGLELVLDERSKVYEAPLQMKANGGMMVIDDFGRQQIPPVELLNRWIVALEGGVDHLSLYTGQIIEVPFDVIPFFSTNLPPESLADEAFLRRIRYKVEVPNPTPTEFRTIFAQVCRERQVEHKDGTIDYLLERWYEPHQRELRGCHPRDLVDAIIDAARYEGSGTAALTPAVLDEVCHTYFLTS
ncbi:MAG: ATP-binding protein [Dehalococcoidia bacterium]|jgi:predicted ATPase with chaperone activity